MRKLKDKMKIRFSTHGLNVTKKFVITEIPLTAFKLHQSTYPHTKRPKSYILLGLFVPGDVLLSQGENPQLPSALRSLTSVFGMGTGVTFSLSPPDLFI